MAEVVKSNGVSQLAGSLRGAVKVKSAQQKDSNVTSQLPLNTKYALIFKTIIEEGERTIPSSVYATRQGNYDAIGIGEIPLTRTSVRDDGTVIDETGLADIARVCRVFYDAEYHQEVNSAIEELAKNSSRQGLPEPTKLEIENVRVSASKNYYGYKNDAGEFVPPTHSPLLGGKKITMKAQAIRIEIDKSTSKPIPGTATKVSVALSGRKIEQLKQAIVNQACISIHDDLLEVHFSFSGTTTKAAGQAVAFSAITDQVSVKNSDPVIWEKEILTEVAKLADDGEGIFKASYSAVGVDINKVVKSIKSAIVSHQTYFLDLVEGAEDGEKALEPIALNLKGMGIEFSGKVNDLIQTAIATVELEKGISEVDDEETLGGELLGTETIDEMQKVATEAGLDMDEIAGEALSGL